MNIEELLAQLRNEWLSDMADLENRLRSEMDEKITKALEAHGHREYFPYTEWNKNVQILVKRFEQIEKHIELIERRLLTR